MARTSIRPEEEKALAPSAAQAPSTAPASPAADGYDPTQYDDNSRDITIPVLGLIGNTGPNAKRFINKSGQFCLGDLLLPAAVNVIPVAMVKFFAETHRGGKEIKFDDKQLQRRIWPTAEAAFRDDGQYRVDFEKLFPNRIEEQGRIGYLVEQPEGITGPEANEFSHTGPNGKRYAVAKCTYHRGGFRAVWRVVFNNASRLAAQQSKPTRSLGQSELFNAAKGWDASWTLTGELIEGRENAWWEPRIKKCAELDPTMRDWVTNEFGTLRA